jgi:hypothetical protein
MVATSVAWSPLAAHRSLYAPPRTAVARAAADDEAPPEVVEAEANATPYRKWRLAAAGVGVGASAVSAAVALGVLAGVGDDLAPVLPFESPVAALLIDTTIGGACLWAWSKEQETKRLNIQRIWEEVRRRQQGGAPAAGSNRSQRRAEKKGATSRRRAPPAPAPTSASPSNPFGEFFEQANALGRAQAVDLNARLEDAGVLPPLSAQEAAPPPAATAPPVAPEMDVELPAAAAAAAVAPPRRGDRRNAKKKGKKKGKR